MAWACMAAKGSGSLVLIDDVTDDKISKTMCIGLQYLLQPHASKLIGLYFTVQMDSDLKVKKWNILQLSMHFTY